MTTENEQEKTEISASKYWPIFDRVASILEQARSNVGRTVNSKMVWVYSLIGREIVEELQGGEDRAAYGKKFSWRNLRLFEQSCFSYKERGEKDPQQGPNLRLIQATAGLAKAENEP